MLKQNQVTKFETIKMGFEKLFQTSVFTFAAAFLIADIVSDMMLAYEYFQHEVCYNCGGFCFRFVFYLTFLTFFENENEIFMMRWFVMKIR